MIVRIGITGPDGCGKSSVVKAAAELFSAEGIETSTVSIWDALETQAHFQSKAEIMRYLAGLQGWARVYFLMHGLAILSQLVEAARGDVVLVDAYWYKYYLAESMHQPELCLGPGLFQHLAPLDWVAYIPTPLHVIAERKQGFSRYECGGLEASRENFVRFQIGLHRSWQSLLSERSECIELSCSTTPEQYARQLLEKVRAYDRRGGIDQSRSPAGALCSV